ncbi:hypothetical protein Tdes44962_MAKER06280 [Teratosphaeria destructans]|uniref:Uncharacterized protein n=1 Tax=Teratosphaeria destructans TaxID=418781 RepID=A0A9W7SHT7_9PEZI|nr:hypothetical protein Tdes44962_MAKER06280 [Teratosphaeria destructans]
MRRNLAPYRMNSNGTGRARQATAPRIEQAGPTAEVVEQGPGVRGQAGGEQGRRRKVLAETAEAA